MKWAEERNRSLRPDAPPPAATPHRSHKNTRRWCRGKKGIEHVQVVRYRHEALERRNYPVVIPGGRRGLIQPVERPLCGWACRWRRERRTDGVWSIPDQWVWSCSHEVGCSVCGKRLAVLHGIECPDYRQLTEADTAKAVPRRW